MGDEITQAGVVVVAVIVILDKILAFVKKRNGNGLPDAKMCMKHSERLASLESSIASLTQVVGDGFQRIEERIAALEKKD